MTPKHYVEVVVVGLAREVEGSGFKDKSDMPPKHYVAVAVVGLARVGSGFEVWITGEFR